jgi:hypothetical protein
MPYEAVCNWAGGDFHRLVAAAKARDYRPEWVAHQLENQGKQLSAQEAEILQRMITAEGPYISRRRRWIMRMIRIKPMTEKALVTMAASAPEYRDLKQIERAVQNDIRGLLSLGMASKQGGKVQTIAAPPEHPAERRVIVVGHLAH